ncbi:MAG TPA: CAP domain-containing protein [Acidimicrobiia bacterium]|nr:CAP domain-containing protein [Acidimicrobiia bacterium]
MLRRAVVVAAALLACLGGPLGLLRASAASDFTAMTNADRTAHGLKALSTAADLQALAQQHAQDMARAGVLAHTPNLGTKISGWQRLGENVGRGPHLADIETAFMNSPSHRENILDPAFTQVGVGVVFDGKEYFYVSVEFRQPSGVAVAAPPAPKPAPAPAPRVATAPKPKPATTTTRPAPTTTTAPPTTTTTAPPPPPAPEEVPRAIETTTTTAPRPIFDNPDFLAANFSDRIVPAAAKTPVPPRSRTELVVTAAAGVVLGAAGTGFVALRRPQAPRLPRLPRR